MSHRLTAKILARYPRTPIVEISTPEPMEPQSGGEEDKQTLHLVRFQGDLLKPCPGTKGYICCGYQILHTGTNCPLNCSYCILQAYLNQPSLRVFANLEERLTELSALLDSDPQRIFRIGTGEFMDSLALDPAVGWTDMLLPFFSSRSNVVLELKTKTECIHGLLASRYRRGIVVSWSLSAPEVASGEEHKAPSVQRRLQAARRCQEEGFIVGFHFDPLVFYPGWKEGYRRTIEMLSKTVDPAGVIWVSLGCMRYVPALRSLIRKRHPRSHVLDAEFVRGPDGKMRVFKPIRIEMYRFMAENLRKWNPDLGLYLCMESSDVWQDAMGWSPAHTAGLSGYLDRRALGFFSP